MALESAFTIAMWTMLARFLTACSREATDIRPAVANPAVGRERKTSPDFGESSCFSTAPRLRWGRTADLIGHLASGSLMRDDLAKT